MLSYKFIEIPFQEILRDKKFKKENNIRFFISFTTCVFLFFSLIKLNGIPLRSKGSLQIFSEALPTSREYPSDCGGLKKNQLRLCQVGISRYGNDVLVIGDSFAEMWYPRARVLEPKLSSALVFSTYGGCPALPGLERTFPGFNCSQFYNRSLELANSGRFSRVIFIGQWAGYFKKNRQDIELNGLKISEISNIEINNLISEFENDLNKIKNKGIEIVILKTSPLPEFDVPLFVRKKTFKGLPLEDNIINWEESRNIYLPIDDAFNRLAANNNGIKVIDPRKYLCENNVCYAIKDGKPLYSDKVHIKPAIAREKGVFLDPYFINNR